jgi:hypothetical protein
MKEEKAPAAKPPEDRFKELGRKVMSVPKAEVDARDKAWHANRRKPTSQTRPQKT